MVQFQSKYRDLVSSPFLPFALAGVLIPLVFERPPAISCHVRFLITQEAIVKIEYQA